jgi:hypothetical protein
VRLEASTKPHVHQKFEIFWTNIASTVACPNFRNGPKNGLGPLGVKHLAVRLLCETRRKISRKAGNSAVQYYIS